MTAILRKAIYQKLTPKTRAFVDTYVEERLGIAKFLKKEENTQSSHFNENLTQKNSEQSGNIGKIITKKYTAGNSLRGENFENWNPAFLNFLFPEYETSLLNPFNMKDMHKAVERVVSAILDNELICIYSDYDCDGVPGISMVRDFFEMIAYKNVIYYIPNRHKEGYGLNLAALDKIAGEGAKLIITIDLGITNIKEIEKAGELGMDVIVTDHHLPIETEDGQQLPKALAILNAKQNSCTYNDKNLCGSGVVFKLICAILDYDKKHTIWKLGDSREKWLLDLAGIATVADMVPLVGENRTLAIYGLYVLSKTRREGLRTLLKNSKTDISKITENDIAFSIAPRINAASRMDHPRHAFDMFSTDVKKGIDSAHYLEELNTLRKDSVASIMKKVYKHLDEKYKASAVPDVIVVGDSDWTPGVLGIVASNILEKYNRSTFVWGKGDDEKSYKGSCRSIGDVHVVQLMTLTKNLYTHFGGHEAAGGFALSFKHIHELEKSLNEKYSEALLKQRHEIEAEKKLARQIGHESNTSLAIDLEDVTSELLTGLSLIGPFGVGNPKPIFTLRNVQSFEVKRFGKKNEHVKIILQSRTTKREAIKFFTDIEKEKELANNVHELHYTLEAGYQGGLPRLKIVS